MGAAIIRYDKVSDHFWTGLMLVQLSNLSFAIGMVGYKRLMERVRCRSITRLRGSIWGRFWWQWRPWFMLGNPAEMPNNPTVGSRSGLAWAASGMGYFMWNYGATQVDAGTLGIMNNVHVPAGLLVNLAIWQEQPHWPSFLLQELW